MALRVRVCRADEVVDHELHAFAVEGVTWPVIVVRLDGVIVATPGVCPHEDVGLATGAFDGHLLTCPGHGYQFDLETGRCTHDPGLVLRRLDRPLTLAVPDYASIERGAAGQAAALTSAVRGDRVAIWTELATVTPDAQAGKSGAISAERILLPAV